MLLTNQYSVSPDGTFSENHPAGKGRCGVWSRHVSRSCVEAGALLQQAEAGEAMLPAHAEAVSSPPSWAPTQYHSHTTTHDTTPHNRTVACRVLSCVKNLLTHWTLDQAARIWVPPPHAMTPPRRTNHEWDEPQDGLRLLLLRVVSLGRHDLLAGPLAQHKQRRQHQVRPRIMPTNWRRTINKGEQPVEPRPL